MPGSRPLPIPHPASDHRYFREWPSYTQCITYLGGGPWLGSPVSILLRREHASELRSVLENATSDGWAVDVALEVHHLPTHYVASEPQLCHELGEGTSFQGGDPEP